MTIGQHILLSLLSEYTKSKTPSEELEDVSDRLKAGLLLHGSSSNAMWKTVDELTWISVTDEKKNDTKRQGLGLKQQNLPLSDVFDLMTQNSNIPDALKAEYPKLTHEAYQAGVQTIWLLLRALEWSHNGTNNDIADDFNSKMKEDLIASYIRKIEEYKSAPDDYS